MKVRKNLPLLLFIVVLVIVYSLSTLTRSAEYKKFWKGNPYEYYVGDVPMVNTLDAYKWVRIADEYREGTYGKRGTDPLMYFPDGMPEERPVPLLSVMLVAFAPLFDGNLYETGLWLIPWLAGLFMIPFGVYFYRLGYPAAGIFGALAGTFSTFYFMRTAPGRIDTDALNLFFPFLTALMILLACEKGGKYRLFIFAALGGLSQLLFYWWYQHAAFILIFLIAFAASMFVQGRFFKADPADRIPFKQMGIALGVYVICSNPVYFFYSLDNTFDLLQSYFTQSVVFKSGFPNVYQTVSEARGSAAKELITSLFLHPVVFMFGILGLILLCVRKWRQMLAILPVFAMGLLCFIGSIRFTMFLMPFLGLGAGYLINNAFLVIKRTDKRWIKDLLSYGAVALFMAAVYFVNVGPGLMYFFMPRPSIPVEIYRTFNVLKERLPQDSAIYTWWDFGLAIEAQSGLATFHDGMSQNTLKTWMIARSLIGSQERLHRYISYISNEGMTEIALMQNEGVPATGVTTRLDTYDKTIDKNNVYVVYTGDMFSKFPPIYYIGSWDVANGTASGNQEQLNVLLCRPSTESVLNCEGNEFDLAIGMINRQLPVKKIAYVEQGHFEFERSTRYTDSTIHLIAMRQNGIVYELIILNESAYNSAFVQLFLMGNPNGELFEEVVNLFPDMRAFRVKQLAEN